MNKILALGRKAKQGDKKALKELYNINKTVSKQANSQMKELLKKGYTSFGYDAAAKRNKILTGRTRFKHGIDIKQNVDLLIQNALAAEKFLEYDTATVKGYEEMLSNHIAAVEEITKTKIEDYNLFTDFMKTEAFAELMKVDSSQTLEIGVDTIKSEKDIAKFKRLYKKYEDGELTHDELVEQWSGVNPFD